jgi:hypothetical protein
LFLANHLADGVGDFADTVLLSHDAFLAGNHFALFLANHLADGVGDFAYLVFAHHLAALAGYTEVFHFGHHAAFGEGYLLASDFRNHLAAVGTNHIAVFLANIFGAANLAHFGAWFPYFLADGSVGKLDRATSYMTRHKLHSAGAWIHFPAASSANLVHDYLTGDFAYFGSPAAGLNANFLFRGDGFPRVAANHGVTWFHHGFIGGFHDITGFRGVMWLIHSSGAWNLFFVEDWFLNGVMFFLDALFVYGLVGDRFHGNLIGLPNWFLNGVMFFLDALFVNGLVGNRFHGNLIGLPNWFLHSVMFFANMLFVYRFANRYVANHIVGFPNWLANRVRGIPVSGFINRFVTNAGAFFECCSINGLVAHLGAFFHGFFIGNPALNFGDAEGFPFATHRCIAKCAAMPCLNQALAGKEGQPGKKVHFQG